MLEIGTANKGETPEIRLEEDAVVLEAVLPYLYPASVPLLKIEDVSTVMQIIHACEKYQVIRLDSFGRESY